MVFVTVGNANQGFRRLLDAVDILAGKGIFDGQTVFVQSGHNSDFRPKHCEWKPFLPMDEFQERMEKANLVITHGGCTQLQVIHLGKIPIVMPRRKKYGEHVNDHQIQLVEALATEGRIVPAYEPKDLPDAIARAKRESKRPLSSQPSRMFELVAKGIEDLFRLNHFSIKPLM